MAFSVRGAFDLLSEIPTSLFPIALGLAGLGAGLRVAAPVHDAVWLSQAGAGVLIAAGIVLSIDVLLYAAKIFRARDRVAADFAMSTRANLFAPGFMAAMVIGGQFAAVSPLGGPIWLAASVGHLVLLLRFVGLWLQRDYMSEDLNPTWFLPAAGLMTSALSWPGFGPQAFPVFTFAAGFALWLILLPIVFRRLVFEPALDPVLRPSLFILAAPFGLAAGGLLTLYPSFAIGGAVSLLSAGLFFILALISQPRFISAAGISLTWWATTFPIATVAAGYLRLDDRDLPFVAEVGTALLAFATLTTLVAIVGTGRAALRTCIKTRSAAEHALLALQGRSDRNATSA
ncbi:MAG: hypothetical protein AAFQ67_01445 [Pseudomonadota bacterium]